MDEWVEEKIDECLNGEMAGQRDEWMDGMDEWICSLHCLDAKVQEITKVDVPFRSVRAQGTEQALIGNTPLWEFPAAA